MILKAFHQIRISLNRIFISWSLSPKNLGEPKLIPLWQCGVTSAGKRDGHSWPCDFREKYAFQMVLWGTCMYFFKEIQGWNNRGIGIYNIDSGLYFRKHSVVL